MSDKLQVHIDGVLVTLALVERGWALTVDRSFWGYFVSPEVAIRSAYCVIGAPRF